VHSSVNSKTPTIKKAKRKREERRSKGIYVSTSTLGHACTNQLQGCWFMQRWIPLFFLVHGGSSAE
jgi:hypothetical protein